MCDLIRAFNVIISTQLTIFGSQVLCHKLTNTLKALHGSGEIRYNFNELYPPSPHTHISHQVPRVVIHSGLLDWHQPNVCSISESVVAFTSPPVAIFKLLIFSSSAASIELHSITSHIFVAKCFNKTSWDWLLAPNHSAATFVGRGGAKFTGSKATSTAVA